MIRNNIFACQKLFRHDLTVCLKNFPAASFSVKRQKSQQSTADLIKNHNLSVIYQMPYAQLGTTVNKVKLYISALSCVTIPTVMVLEANEITQVGGTVTLVLLAMSTNMALYSFGWLFNKMIGRIYVNEDCSEVMISYLDFWGRRVDRIMSLDDIELVSVHDKHLLRMLFTRVQVYNPDDVLKLQMRNATILNQEKFQKVLGM